MEDSIHLEPLAKDGGKLIDALNQGKMVVARSQDDFLYVLTMNGMFQIFIHTPGSKEGAQRQMPFDEESTEMIRQLPETSDSLYAVEFDKGMDLMSVLASAEDAIVSTFPNMDPNSDGKIEFHFPTGDSDDSEPPPENS